MNNNICEQYDASTIQQLYKIVTDKENDGYKDKDIFPVSIVQSIFDAITGDRLDTILSFNNCLYVPYQGTKEATRISINADYRRQGLIITFKDYSGIVYTQQYNYTGSIADTYWKDSNNWNDCFVSIDNINTDKEFIEIDYFTKDSGNITEEQYKDIECAIKDHKAIKLLFNNEVVVASAAIINTGLSITFGYTTITGEIVIKQEDYSYIITTRELLINKPGESGQVLTKTTTGYEWKTGSAQGIVIDNNLSIDSTNPVENKVITKAINKINAELFPLTINAFGGGVYKLGSTISSTTIRWTIKEGDDIVIPDKLTINDDEVDTSLTNETLYNLKSNTTIKISATKNGITVTSTISFIFVNPSYFGAVSNDFVASEELIIALTENIKNTKKYTGTISLNNQKTCYAYPKSFGALTTIKDSNNFEYINSYTRTELNVNDEVYYIYVLTDATTINNFKQIYS